MLCVILIRIHIRLGKAFKGRGSHTLSIQRVRGSRKVGRTLNYNPSCHVYTVEANKFVFPFQRAEELELESPIWPAWFKSS